MPTISIQPDSDGNVSLPDRRVSDPNFDGDNPPSNDARFEFVDVRILSLTRNGSPVALNTEGERRPAWLTTYSEDLTHEEYEVGEGIRWNLVATHAPFDFELIRPPNPSDVDVYTIEHNAEVFLVDDQGNFSESVRNKTCTWILTVQQVTP